MKIIILTPYAEPEKGACVVRVKKFQEFLLERKHEVKVLSPQRKNIKQIPGVTRYSNLLQLAISIILEKPKIIIGTSPPITHNFVALVATKIIGAKFILDSKDPFTYVMRKLYPEKTKTIKFKILEILEYFTHKFSDKIIFLNKPYLTYTLKKFQLNRKKLFIIPNGCDIKTVYFDKKEGKKIKNKLGIKNAKLLIYVGGIGDKDIQGFIEFSLPYIVKKINLKTMLILSYENSEREKKILKLIKEKTKKYNMTKNIITLFNIEYENLYKYLSAADFGLVAYPDFEMQVIGAKVYDYIAAGLPIFAKASKNNTILKNFIIKNRVGFFADNWKDFNKKFEKNIKNSKFQRNKIQKVAIRYSRMKSCLKLLKLIEQFK